MEAAAGIFPLVGREPCPHFPGHYAAIDTKRSGNRILSMYFRVAHVPLGGGVAPVPLGGGVAPVPLGLVLERVHLGFLE